MTHTQVFRFCAAFMMVAMIVLTGCDSSVVPTGNIELDQKYNKRSAHVTIDAPQTPFYINQKASSFLDVNGKCAGIVDQGETLYVEIELDERVQDEACIDGSYSTRFDVTGLQEGNHSLKVSVQALSLTDNAQVEALLTVDRTAPTLHDLVPLILPVEKVYATNNLIYLYADFSEPVVFTNTNRPAFNILLLDEKGVPTEERTALFSSINRNRAIFSYQVQPGDVAEGGIVIEKVLFNNSELSDIAGNPLLQEELQELVALLPATLKKATIDTKPFTIVSVNPANIVQPKVFIVGEKVLFEMHTNKNVFINNLSKNVTPNLLLDVGTNVRRAKYLSLNNNKMVFVYAIEQHDYDNQGVSVFKLEENGSLITDEAGNRLAPQLPFQEGQTFIRFPNVQVNGRVPKIDGISINNTTYAQGDSIDFTVTYSLDVDVNGKPKLKFSFKGDEKIYHANYSRKNGERQLIFTHQLNDGIVSSVLYIPSNPIVKKEGEEIYDKYNSNESDYSYAGVETAVAVDTQVPYITAVSTNKPGGVVQANESLIIGFELNESVTISKIGATKPSITARIGSDLAYQVKKLTLRQPNGVKTKYINFEYKIENEMQDDDGIVLYNSIEFAGAEFKDDAGNDLSSNLGIWAKKYNQVIDSKAPKPIKIVHPQSGSYSLAAGKNSLDIEVHFSENVRYSDNGDNNFDLGIDVVVGNNTLVASYSKEKNTLPLSDVHYFSVNMITGLDAQGITLDNLWFQSYKGSDTFVDKNNVQMQNETRSLGQSIQIPGVSIDSIAPVITHFHYQSPNFGQSAFAENQLIQLSFRANEVVRFEGDSSSSIFFPFRLGANDQEVEKYAVFSTIDNQNNINFEYRVQRADMDIDGLRSGKSDGDVIFEFTNSSIVDSYGNSLELKGLGSLAGMESIKDIFIDTLPPKIEKLLIAPAIKNTVLALGDSITIEAHINERVRLMNNDQGKVFSLPIILDPNGKNEKITLRLDESSVTQSGSDRLFFSAGVPSNIDTNTIVLDEAALQSINQISDELIDVAGNRLDLDFINTDKDFSGFSILTTTPFVTHVSVETIAGQVDDKNNQYYRAGQRIIFNLTWDQKVSVSSIHTPKLPFRFDKNSTSKQEAVYSGSGGLSRVTRFVYTVRDGDNANSGVFIGNGVSLPAIDGSTDSIVSQTAVPASLVVSQDSSSKKVNLPNVIIDTVKPYISNLKLPEKKTYINGELFEFGFVLSENVRVLDLQEIINKPEAKVYISLYPQKQSVVAFYDVNQNKFDNVLEYNYRVDAFGDTDKVEAISLSQLVNSGNISDWAGNVLSEAKELSISDTYSFHSVGPQIDTVFNHTSNKKLTTGEEIKLEVRFKETISILPLETNNYFYLYMRIDNNGNSIIYELPHDPNANGPTSMFFTWKVLPGIEDLDGIKLGANDSSYPHIRRKFKGPGGVYDNNGIESDYKIDNLYEFTSITIDSKEPRLTSIHLKNPQAYYKELDSLSFAFTFDENVSYQQLVSGASGEPTLLINGQKTVPLTYQSTINNVVNFSYSVENDIVSDATMKLNVGTMLSSRSVVDSAGNAFTDSANFYSIANALNYSSFVIDSTKPVLLNVNVDSRHYAKDDVMNFTAQFSESISLPDPSNPDKVTYTLYVGDNYNQKLYAQKISETELGFSFKVPAGLIDYNGVELKNFNNVNFVKDKAGNFLSSTSKLEYAFSGVVIDSDPPVVTSVSIIDDKGGVSNKTKYQNFDKLLVKLEFSENVTYSNVNGQLVLDKADASKSEAMQFHAALSTSNSIVLEYTVNVNRVHDGTVLFHKLIGSIQDAAQNSYNSNAYNHVFPDLVLQPSIFSISAIQPDVLTAQHTAPSSWVIDGIDLDQVTQVYYSTSSAAKSLCTTTLVSSSTRMTIDCSAYSNPETGTAQLILNNKQLSEHVYQVPIVSQFTFTGLVQPTPTRALGNQMPYSFDISGSNLEHVQSVAIGNTLCNSSGAPRAHSIENVDCSNVLINSLSTPSQLTLRMPDGFSVSKTLIYNEAPVIASMKPSSLADSETAPSDWLISGSNLSGIDSLQLRIERLTKTFTTLCTIIKTTNDQISADCSNSAILKKSDKVELIMIMPDLHQVNSGVIPVNDPFNYPIVTNSIQTVTYGSNFDSKIVCTDSASTPTYVSNNSNVSMTLGGKGSAEQVGQSTITVSCPDSIGYQKGEKNYTIIVEKAQPKLVNFTSSLSFSEKVLEYDIKVINPNLGTSPDCKAVLIFEIENNLDGVITDIQGSVVVHSGNVGTASIRVRADETPTCHAFIQSVYNITVRNEVVDTPILAKEAQSAIYRTYGSALGAIASCPSGKEPDYVSNDLNQIGMHDGQLTVVGVGDGTADITVNCPGDSHNQYTSSSTTVSIYLRKAPITLFFIDHNYARKVDVTGDDLIYTHWFNALPVTPLAFGVLGLQLTDTLSSLKASGSFVYSSQNPSIAEIRNDTSADLIYPAWSSTNSDVSIDVDFVSSSSSNYADTQASYQLRIRGVTPRHAYSLRRISEGKGNKAIQIRRARDGQLSDIGFTPTGDLNTSVMSAFVGNDDAYITTWYDQSGGEHVTQLDTDKQPQIMDMGQIIVQANGKVAVRFDGVDDFVQAQFVQPITERSLAALLVVSPSDNNVADAGILVGFDSTTAGDASNDANVVLAARYELSSSVKSFSNLLQQQSDPAFPVYGNDKAKQLSIVFSSGNLGIWVNGMGPGTNRVNQSFPRFNLTHLYMGARYGAQSAQNFSKMLLSEVLLYNESILAIRNNIETNQHNYWDIIP